MEKPCKHEAFQANVEVSRLEDIGQFTADVTVWCAHCGVRFKFLGMKSGLDLRGACVSHDGLEARLSIAPADEKLKPPPPGVRGFDITVR